MNAAIDLSEHQGLLVTLCRRWRGAVSRSQGFDDLLQEANVAALLALPSYDPSKGALSTYLRNAVMFRMTGHVLPRAGAVRVPMTTQQKARRAGRRNPAESFRHPVQLRDGKDALEAVSRHPLASCAQANGNHDPSEERDPESLAERAQLQRISQELLELLSPKQRYAVEQHCRGRTFREIAEEQGVSFQAIQGNYDAAMRRLRATARLRGVLR